MMSFFAMDKIQGMCPLSFTSVPSEDLGTAVSKRAFSDTELHQPSCCKLDGHPAGIASKRTNSFAQAPGFLNSGFVRPLKLCASAAGDRIYSVNDFTDACLEHLAGAHSWNV